MKKTNIDFKITKCKDMLYGLQDVNTCLINDDIFILCGFCCGLNSFFSKYPKKLCDKFISKINNKQKYPRGFSKKILKYSIKNNNWINLGELPIKPRQCAFSIVIKNKIYIWGGYSYTPLTNEELSNLKILPSKKNICTFNDGIGIEYINNKIKYFNIPFLPYPLTNSSIIHCNNKIYFFGGAIYGNKSFDTTLLINNIEIGKSFFSMDLDENGNIINNNLDIINNFTGTCRINNIFFEQNNELFVIGGSSIQKKITKEKSYPEYTPVNVIDNWKYNINEKKWIRLQDLPFLIVQQGFVKYKNKYIIMIGGTKYNYTKLLNNKIVLSNNIKLNKFDFNLKYNGISNIKRMRPIPKNSGCSYNWYFSNLIIIYDIDNDTYLLPSKKLNININKPGITLYKDSIYITGGEANTTLINNVYYGNHISLVYKLDIILND